MSDQDKSKKRRDPSRARIDARRAADIVKSVRGADDQPFGPLRLVRAVIRPKKRGVT